jgi:phosphohistidine phosphatase SixA
VRLTEFRRPNRQRPNAIVLALALALSIILVLLSWRAAQTQPVCEFVLGFADMYVLVGPATVGNCVENERFVAGNGNAEQRTTNGILVFSGLDRMMRFIGSERTWIIGPDGLVERPNNQRFEWEGDRQLVEALRQGGYFVYFRHGPTDSTQQDSDPNNLANCATQRNLTDAGHDLAATIGMNFRTLRIPVGNVLSSPYCRAKEHAFHSFGRAELVPSMAIPDPLPPEIRQRNTAEFERLFANLPAPGTNTVMVAHSPNIRDAFGYGLALADLPVEGGAAILLPAPAERPTIVARLLPGEWAVFAQALAIL